MIQTIKWTAPPEALRWQWQVKDWPMIKGLIRLYFACSLLLGLPVTLAYFVNPSTTMIGPTVLACVVPLFALTTIALPWIARLLDMVFGKHYSLSQRGPRLRGSEGYILYPWSQVEAFRIVPHSHLPGISVLELHIAGYRDSLQRCFRPDLTDLDQLTRTTISHLPHPSSSVQASPAH